MYENFFPELKIFTEVHLRSFGGYDMHAIANGFYFIKNCFNNCSIDSENFPQYFCDYYKCNLEQFNILKDSENKFEFSVLLVELGIVKGWKNKANKAIKKLEQLTGKKFKSSYDRDKNEIITDTKKLKEFRELKKFRDRKHSQCHSVSLSIKLLLILSFFLFLPFN